MRAFETIVEQWWDMWDNKEAYAFGDEEIDLEAFKSLVKDTYFLFKEMNEHIENGDYADVLPAEMNNYLSLVSAISMYSATCYTDNSEGHSFALTRLLAVELSNLGVSFGDFSNGDGIITSNQGMDYGMDETIYYDVNDGDLSVFEDLAKRAGC